MLCKWTLTMVPLRIMRQALRLIGELHLHRDSRTFHEETFACRKFFLLGPGWSTSYVNVRHLSRRPGEILLARDMEPLLHFLRFLRKTPQQLRSQWMSSLPQEIVVRSFRWASRERNDFVTILVKQNHLLIVIAADYSTSRGFVEEHCAIEQGQIRHRISWF